ncbi:DUF2310 family Zn-ribbon-containing protein [Pontibacter populi]|uniref:DUF2310 family Zn-ribbon-containing protein n=1 Tax=Pontibacter populi TaxID=890055 RepID=A0ABV1RQ34_9BACT
MKDKPIAAKIILPLANEKDTGEEFLGLSGTLYRQNLIYAEPRELRKVGGTLELTVTFQDFGSFQSWENSPDVVEYWSEKFNCVLTSSPKTVEESDVIIDVDETENCSCNSSAFYLLYGRSLQFTNELVCGTCLGQIPYSSIPAFIEIENWQRHYQRVYLNWLESSFFEKEAYKELTNYKKGKLNTEGEKIRKQLSEHFGIPVYINLFVDQPDANHSCLICGGKGVSSGLKTPSSICENCNTAFN